MTNFVKNGIKVFSLAAALALAAPQSAWAGNWVRQDEKWLYEENGTWETGWQFIEDQWYYFDSQGIMMTGWVKTPENPKWYYLNQSHGAWEAKPPMTEEAACHLLENALKEAGMYQDEEREIQYKVDYVTKDIIKISIGYEKIPDIFTTINTYEVDRKNRTARSVTRDQLYQL